MGGRRTAAALTGLITAVVAAGCGGGSAPAAHDRTAATRAGEETAPAAATTTLHLGAPGRAVPAGFLGLSMEFQAIRAYTGTDPHAVDPVFAALVRGLSPGQRPVLRIGGDSTDVSWAPAAGVAPPRFAGYRYPLTRGWFATTAALAHELDARMILGLNIAAGEPALDGAEARADLRAFGRGSIDALELGNEPNLYASIPLWKLADGRPVTARPRRYGPAGYRREVAATLAALPAADPAWAFAGPALAASQDPDPRGRWARSIAPLLRSEPAMRLLTLHRYPLKNCYTSPRSPQYPTIPHLLSEYATSGLAAGLRGWVSIARAQGRTVRIDELGSAACRGKAGVSNTFASALWATDALFSLAAVGVGGVNIHTLPQAAYQLFEFRHTATPSAAPGGRWVAHVEPEYYGLELFAQAAPAGARLVAVGGAAHTRSLSAWATRAPDGSERLVLIDKDPGRARVVRIPVPTGTDARGVSVERLTAPGIAATGGVTLGGRSFGAATRTGTLPAPRTTPATRTPGGGRWEGTPPQLGGDVVVRVPGGSAALVTFPG